MYTYCNKIMLGLCRKSCEVEVKKGHLSPSSSCSQQGVILHPASCVHTRTTYYYVPCMHACTPLHRRWGKVYYSLQTRIAVQSCLLSGNCSFPIQSSIWIRISLLADQYPCVCVCGGGGGGEGRGGGRVKTTPISIVFERNYACIL